MPSRNAGFQDPAESRQEAVTRHPSPYSGHAANSLPYGAAVSPSLDDGTSTLAS